MPSKLYFLISALFITCLIISNIIAVKIGDFWGYYLPVAVIVFPITYIIADVVTEVYGFVAMRRIIWLGFLCNLIAVIFFYLGGLIPSAPFFPGQSAYSMILGFTPRLLAASFIAYLIGEFSNSYVLAKLKVKTAGKYLWVRTIGSTIIGEGLDSAIFITLAFWGIPGIDLGLLIMTQWGFKVLFETLATPFTYLIVGYLKRREQLDTYDRQTNFNPLQF